MSGKPKILLFDIETAPMLSYHWSRWQQNINQQQVVKESCILTFSAKWLDDKKVITRGLDDYGTVESLDDSALCQELWSLMDEAAVVVGHYVKRFDIPEVYKRFSIHGFPPPSPFKAVCTKEAAKRYFRHSSNRLGDLGVALGLGGKLSHEGFDMWRKCLEGDPKAWKKMKAYNKQDVVLLEKVYKRLLPYMKNHPNLGTIVGGSVCPNCGGSHIQSRGTSVTNTGVYQRFQCQNPQCGAWFRGAKRLEAPTEYRSIG